MSDIFVTLDRIQLALDTLKAAEGYTAKVEASTALYKLIQGEIAQGYIFTASIDGKEIQVATLGDQSKIADSDFIFYAPTRNAKYTFQGVKMSRLGSIGLSKAGVEG